MITDDKLVSAHFVPQLPLNIIKSYFFDVLLPITISGTNYFITQVSAAHNRIHFNWFKQKEFYIENCVLP